MVRRAFKGFVNFVRLVRHMPPDTSSRYTAGTNEIRDATRAAFPPRGGGLGGGGGGGGSRKTDKMIGKAIADSHQITKHGKPRLASASRRSQRHAQEYNRKR